MAQTQFGLLAQLVEQLTFNQLVEGSNPSQPTIFKTSQCEVFLCLSKISYKLRDRFVLKPFREGY